MSDLGKTRWRHVIDSKLEFTPFKDFAQLHAYMTEDQKNRLDVIVAKRNLKASVPQVSSPNQSQSASSEELSAHPSSSTENLSNNSLKAYSLFSKKESKEIKLDSEISQTVKTFKGG